MGKLIYSMITSLDGYVADPAGNFDWGEPDEELHTSSTRSQRRSAPTSTAAACTRRWSTGRPPTPFPTSRTRPGLGASWQAADKVVYSTTLEEVAVRS